MRIEPKPEQRASRLMELLRSVAADRGAMAELRCAWSEVRRSRAWPWLGRVGLIGDVVAETVAGAFGYHPEESREDNFGTACRRLAGRQTGAEQRFAALLRSNRAEACLRIRPLILALRSAGIALNHEQLASDLWYWGDAVRRRWAQEFWVGASEQAEPGNVVAAEASEEASGRESRHVSD